MYSYADHEINYRVSNGWKTWKMVQHHGKPGKLMEFSFSEQNHGKLIQLKMILLVLFSDNSVPITF